MVAWVVSSIVVWAALQVLAIQWCTDWRDEKANYGLIVLLPFVLYLPEVFFGSEGALAVMQIVAVAGFPIAAIYLAGLLIDELVEGRKIAGDES